MITSHYSGLLQNDRARLAFGGLWGSSKAYMTALIRRQVAAPCLLITPSQKRAEELFEDLQFFQRIGLLPYSPEQIHLYSQWNVAPYEHESPHRDIVSERLIVLDKLTERQNILIVAPVEAVMHKTLPRDALSAFTMYIGAGEALSREGLAAMLVDTGYKHAPLVENRGEFSMRGGILDVFPAFGDHPLRIEFFGDEVESLRAFDPTTQRSTEKLEMITVLPGREIVISEKTAAAAKRNIDARVAEIGASLNSLKALMNHIEEHIFFPGIEWYATYFHNRLESLLDYLAPETLIVLDEPAEIADISRKFDAFIQKEYRQTEEKGYPLPAPESIFMTPDALLDALAKHRQIALQLLNVGATDANMFDISTKSLEWTGTFTPSADDAEDKDRHIGVIARRIGEWIEDRYRVVIASYTEFQAKRLWEILRDHNVAAQVASADAAVLRDTATQWGSCAKERRLYVDVC